MLTGVSRFLTLGGETQLGSPLSAVSHELSVTALGRRRFRPAAAIQSLPDAFWRCPGGDVQTSAVYKAPRSGAELALFYPFVTLKEKDDPKLLIAQLERLLTLRDISKHQRSDLERELDMFRAGLAGEKETAYHIDFHWKDGGRNSAVIHDLRIEHGGRVAQIDHLIVTRTLDCHVLESKGFTSQVRVSDSGEWEAKTRFGWRGILRPSSRTAGTLRCSRRSFGTAASRRSGSGWRWRSGVTIGSWSRRGASSVGRVATGTRW